MPVVILLCIYFDCLNRLEAATFVVCLLHMTIEGPDESLLKYTQEWVQKVDRGGLFEVCDDCYHFFCCN